MQITNLFLDIQTLRGLVVLSLSELVRITSQVPIEDLDLSRAAASLEDASRFIEEAGQDVTRKGSDYPGATPVVDTREDPRTVSKSLLVRTVKEGVAAAAPGPLSREEIARAIEDALSQEGFQSRVTP